MILVVAALPGAQIGKIRHEFDCRNPLDRLYDLQPIIPQLARSSLRRCFQRHAVERLPEIAGNKAPKKKFKAYPIGYFHIDIAELRTSEDKLHLFVAIDRTSKFAYVELHERAPRSTARQILLNLIKVVPYKIHTVLTDNGVQFTDPKGESRTPSDIKQALKGGRTLWCHAFEYRAKRIPQRRFRQFLV